MLSIFLFAVSSNLDNLVVGFSYGIKKIHVSLLSNLIIAFITFAGTLASMLAGSSITHFIPISIASAIGSVILIGIGIFSLIIYFRNRKNEALWHMTGSEKYDKNENKKIEYNEAVTLGLALTINNIGLGIGAAISGLGVLPTAIGSFIFSILFLYIGNVFGDSFLSEFIGKYAEPIAAIIIIILGIWEFCA